MYILRMNVRIEDFMKLIDFHEILILDNRYLLLSLYRYNFILSL